jgi:hypothetical protein
MLAEREKRSISVPVPNCGTVTWGGGRLDFDKNCAKKYTEII